jgi:hypothetical protein
VVVVLSFGCCCLRCLVISFVAEIDEVQQTHLRGVKKGGKQT